MDIKLAIVVPCYNEEVVLHETTIRLSALLDRLVDSSKVSDSSFILFVNDGSRDRTWDLIASLFLENKYVKGLNLAGNVGHQNALMAGLLTAKEYADAIISIDADLQDDVNVIEEMVDRYKEGFDIVYGVRNSRDADTFFKKNTALAFYKLMSWLGVKSVYNHADYRLMSRRAVEQLGNYKERNLFLRGIVPLIGYETTSVFYRRSERFAGESKYPLSKMFNFAIDGITSFSVRPLRLIASLGFLFLFCSLIAVIYTLHALIAGETVAGWASLMLSVWFLGSLILIAIGIAGEYIGKIYLEVKERPRYNIEQFLEEKK